MASTNSQPPLKRQRTDDANPEPIQKVTVYRVIRTLEPSYHDETEEYIRGLYLKLKNANKAAEQDLYMDWSESFFDEYKESEDDGKVVIDAVGGENDVFQVFVQEKEMMIKVPRPAEKKMVYAVMQAAKKDAVPALHSIHTKIESANSTVKTLGLDSEASPSSPLASIPGARSLVRGLKGLPDSVRIVDSENSGGSWVLVFAKEMELLGDTSSDQDVYRDASNDAILRFDDDMIEEQEEEEEEDQGDHWELG